ncbi:MAG TPA: HDOD domain-containing protein [Polyangiales bacterium]|nr:HDOD domain-containing protein [Polyangiales bacterium]
MANPPPRASRPQPRSAAEYGAGAHSVEPNPDDLENPEELQKRLLQIFESPNYRPPVLPGVALELTELSRNADASYEDVVAVLQKDPLIVAGVLKVAQSPVYGGRLPLQSLKDAVQRLGLNTLRDVVWQVAADMRLFHVKRYTGFMERLQKHSMFMAHAARLVATRAGVAAEHAFLCGLLHDVGVSGTLIALAETEPSAPALEFLLAAIDQTHERAGGQIARMWGLAPEIVATIEQHHQYDPNRPGAPVLTAVLCVAESLAESLGYSTVEVPSGSLRSHGFDRYSAPTLELSLKRLRLNGKQDDLRARAEQLSEQLKAG